MSSDDVVGLVIAVLIGGVSRGRAALSGEALMTTHDWLFVATIVVAIIVATPLLGSYMAKVFGDGPAPGDRVFGPVERVIYRVCGVDPEREQRWTVYALSLLAFSLVSVLGPVRAPARAAVAAAEPRPT